MSLRYVDSLGIKITILKILNINKICNNLIKGTKNYLKFSYLYFQKISRILFSDSHCKKKVFMNYFDEI